MSLMLFTINCALRGQQFLINYMKRNFSEEIFSPRAAL